MSGAALVQLLAQNPIGEVLMATPALSEGVLYVRGMQSVFAIGKPGAAPAAKAAGKP